MFRVDKVKMDYRDKEMKVFEKAIEEDGDYYCTVCVSCGDDKPKNFSEEAVEKFLFYHDIDGYAVSGSYEDCMAEFNE